MDNLIQSLLCTSIKSSTFWSRLSWVIANYCVIVAHKKLDADELFYWNNPALPPTGFIICNFGRFLVCPSWKIFECVKENTQSKDFSWKGPILYATVWRAVNVRSSRWNILILSSHYENFWVRLIGRKLSKSESSPNDIQYQTPHSKFHM